jgi:hypothetical protein
MSSLRQTSTSSDLRPQPQSPRLRALQTTPRSRTRPPRLDGYRGAIALATTAAALIAVVWLAPAEVLDASAQAVDRMQRGLSPTTQGVATVVLASVALLGLVITWARRTALGRPVTLPAGGQISTREIAMRLERLIEDHEDIRRAEVVVDNLHRRGLRVSTRIHVGAHANLNGAIRTVTEATELLLHGHLLVRLSSPPSVELHFDELDLRSGRVHDQRTSAAHR